MSTDPQTVSYTGYNVSNTSLKDFLQHKIFQEIQEATTVMPLKCQDCCWEKVCGGGGITTDLVSRKDLIILQSMVWWDLKAGSEEQI